MDKIRELNKPIKKKRTANKELKIINKLLKSLGRPEIKLEEEESKSKTNKYGRILTKSAPTRSVIIDDNYKYEGKRKVVIKNTSRYFELVKAYDDSQFSGSQAGDNYTRAKAK